MLAERWGLIGMKMLLNVAVGILSRSGKCCCSACIVEILAGVLFTPPTHHRTRRHGAQKTKEVEVNFHASRTW